MSPSVTESVLQSNGTASIPQMPRSTEAHQPIPAPSSNSSSTQRGVNEHETSAQAAKRGANKGSAPAESSRPESKVLPSFDALCGRDDLNTTRSPHKNTTSQNTSINISKPNLTHEKGAPSPSSIDPTTSAPSAANEPPKTPSLAADLRPDDDEPMYNIGEIKIFDQTQKAVPRLYEARWHVIHLDIFDRVHKRLGRGRFAVRFNKPKAPTTIELMSAGVTKAGSMPAVVVAVPKYINKMQGFLDTDSTVQHRCKPKDGTTVELLALACKSSSTLIGMLSKPLRNDIEVSPESNSDDFSDDGTLNSADDSDSSTGLNSTPGLVEVDAQSVSVICEPSNVHGDEKHGMGIRLITKDGSRGVRGTCGGILQLAVPNQPPRQLGLIAGHLLDLLCQDSQEEKRNETDSSPTTGDILYPKSLGHVPRYDWALFDAANFGFAHEMANHDKYIVAQESEIPDVNTMVVIRTSRGEMTGMLSSSASGVMLNPDQGFIHVRTIMMDSGSTITKGDSGAWVFHKQNQKIYGYIIATNGSGHAYMVLLHAAIAEMQTVLGAASVTLAISTDPDSHPYPGSTHEHAGQTETSVAVTGRDEPIQSVAQVLHTIQRREKALRAYAKDRKYRVLKYRRIK